MGRQKLASRLRTVVLIWEGKVCAQEIDVGWRRDREENRTEVTFVRTDISRKRRQSFRAHYAFNIDSTFPINARIPLMSHVAEKNDVFSQSEHLFLWPPVLANTISL